MSTFRTSRSFIVIARDDQIVAMTKRALSPYRRTRFASSGRTGIELARSEQDPVGMLIAHELGDIAGLDVLTVLRKVYPYVPAVLLGSDRSRGVVSRGYELRASTIELPLTRDALMPFAFRALTEEVVPDERVGCLVESLVRSHVLTDREAELLVHVISDLPREKILDRMGISANTLKAHVRSVLVKLDAGDLDKLAARVFRVALAAGGRSPHPSIRPPPRLSSIPPRANETLPTRASMAPGRQTRSSVPPDE